MISGMSMNRRQRRLQEKKAGRKTTKKTRGNAALAAEKKAQGMALKNAGREAEAVPLLKEALRLDSSLADAHFALAMMARMKPGLKINIDEINKTLADKDNLLKSYATILMILKQKRQYKEAKICQEEYCHLIPDDPSALMDLGLVQNMAYGGGENAILDMARAVNMAPDHKVIKALFATSIHNASFTKFHPEIKEAALHCFSSIYDVNLHRFSTLWVGHMTRDPMYEGVLASSVLLTKDEFFKWLDSLDKQTGAFLKDPYFVKGLRTLIIPQYKMERMLTMLRRYICLNFDNLVSNDRIKLFEQFIYALAEQCFFNEYVYIQDDDETEIIKDLLNKIEGRPNKITIGLVSCYHPMHKVIAEKAEALHLMAQEDPHFKNLIKAQLDDPKEEEKLKEEIPVFGDFANEISKAVQSQYEENPYPRWITFPTHPLPNDDMAVQEKDRNKPYNILVAGCGTGRQPLSTVVRHPNATVTAIDLSRASIAYALRKARECRMADRIKFVHADILSMADWPEEFDSIECSGVLHHMEDPFEGWKALNSRLKPGGYFKIGLYSETARQQIVEARNFINQNKYEATVEGIRSCRKAVFDLPSKHPMREFLLNSGDFFATSLVRDLVFHVQEHRMTLPQIKGMMDKLGLECVKFTVPSLDAAKRYDKMYPDDPQRSSMENWAAFEKKYPNTFVSMYQFWCQKIT